MSDTKGEVKNAKHGVEKYGADMPPPTLPLILLEQNVKLGLRVEYAGCHVAHTVGTGILVLRDRDGREFKVEISQVAGPE